MENRWKFSFTSDQLNKLIYVTWVNDDRPMPASLQKESEESVISLSKDKMPEKPIGNLERLQLKFWTEFVEYCKQKVESVILHFVSLWHKTGMMFQ